MTYRPPVDAETLADRFGLRVAARLSQSSEELPYEVTERLRAARMQALAHRKVVKLQPARQIHSTCSSATMALGDEELGLWGRLAAGLPLLALLVGLVIMITIQDDDRAIELAEVDAALLTDDLPPSAYTDPGFQAYLANGDRVSSHE